MDFTELEPRRIATLGRFVVVGCVGVKEGVVALASGDVVLAEVGDFSTLVGVSTMFCLTRGQSRKDKRKPCSGVASTRANISN